jgi:D-amino-acid dehydrogenase
MALHVVVVGGGIVGAASALELLRDGQRVTIVEPGDPGGEQAASYGNGGWLSVGSVLPVSAPGLWRKVPGYLADPLGPLTIRWSYLPRLLPWLTRFLRAGATWDRVERVAAALAPLVLESPEWHRRLAGEAGVPHLIERRGLLYTFPDRAAFEAEARSWAIRRAAGVRWIELDENELRQREPALARRYTFGVLMEEGGHCTDPGALVAALVAHAEAQGAELRRTRATGLRLAGGRLAAVLTEAGEIACDRVVLAAGARSAALAAAAGDRVVLETERGYHAVIAAPEVMPRHPIMPSDGKMVYTPMDGGLRVAGQVELAGLEAAPNWQRAEVLRRHLQASFPDLARDLPPERIRVWMGHRPSTPDGLPCIGPGNCPDVIHAYGHGHIGLSTGPLTGALVADVIAGRKPRIDIAPFSPGRFA